MIDWLVFFCIIKVEKAGGDLLGLNLKGAVVMPVWKQSFICRIAASLALIFIGTIGMAALLIAEAVGIGFYLAPFVIFCAVLILGGLLWLVSTPDKKYEIKEE